MFRITPTRRARHSEEGYVLVAVVFMTVILVLALAVALPRVRESIQRDRDLETVQRGKQYTRAIQLYYRKFHTYPPSIDALIKTNNIRFLRKKYVDPTTGKDEWKPIPYGQNKTPLAMGFFGQPLAVASGAGMGSAGGFGTAGIGGTSFGATTPTGSGLFNTTPTTGSADTGTGTTPSTGSAGGATGGTDPGSNPAAGQGAGSSTPAGGSSGGAGSTTGPTTSGKTFGGAGIIGFSPQSPKQSLYVYKKKNHYNEWEFLYSPQMDQQIMRGGNAGTIGQPASSTTIPVGGSTQAPSTPTTPTTPANPSSPTPQQ